MSASHQAESHANRTTPPAGGVATKAARAAERVAAAAARQNGRTPPAAQKAAATPKKKRIRNRGKKAAPTNATRTPTPPAPNRQPPALAIAAGRNPLAAFLGEKLSGADTSWSKDQAAAFQADVNTALPRICGFA